MAFRPRIGLLALAIGALLAPVGVILAPRDGATVLVLAASSVAAAEAVSLADGVILAPVGRFGLLARSAVPGFSTRLYSSGAALVLAGLGGGCSGQARDPFISARRSP
ncbi:hypothetical protein ASE66_09675 [Bosea sp. Root483D1]|uniref:hypothetical protein n=1 Tax=Bosea sp. Root483D1 TaxID=1736544 RepID=UPI000708A9C8|nr:hypothetical protein [Bosea sp. Root483D1]KRE16033.1 hypothetical protein ASE66_09675 [Bosea sp. Root483D1]